MNTKAQTRTLEERLRAIEDRLEIYNLIASHPPSADTGADYFIRAIYAEDGAIDLAAATPDVRIDRRRADGPGKARGSRRLAAK